MTSLLHYIRLCALITLVALLTGACANRSVARYLDFDTSINLAIGAKATPAGLAQEVFFTVADLRIDGRSVPGFRRVTVDLAGLDEMKGTPLYGGHVDLGDSQLLELVLDGTTDADGNGPGCYVLRDGKKYPIAVGDHHTLQVQTTLLSDRPSETARATVVVDLSRALVFDDTQDNYRLAANNYYRRYLELVQEQPDTELLGDRLGE